MLASPRNLTGEYEYTKPTYTLAAADPVKQQQFVEETFPALKKD